MKKQEELKGYCYRIREEREMEVVIYAPDKRAAEALAITAHFEAYAPKVLKKGNPYVEVREDDLWSRDCQFEGTEDIEEET